jgi:hypothetical protein
MKSIWREKNPSLPTLPLKPPPSPHTVSNTGKKQVSDMDGWPPSSLAHLLGSEVSNSKYWLFFDSEWSFSLEWGEFCFPFIVISHNLHGHHYCVPEVTCICSLQNFLSFLELKLSPFSPIVGFLWTPKSSWILHLTHKMPFSAIFLNLLPIWKFSWKFLLLLLSKKSLQLMPSSSLLLFSMKHSLPFWEVKSE